VVVQSEFKAFVLLRAFAPRPPILAASQLASKVQMPMSTLHCLLKRFAEDGLLSWDSSGRYILGQALYTIGILCTCRPSTSAKLLGPS